MRFLDVQLYSRREFESFDSKFLELTGIEGDVISAQSYDAATVLLEALRAGHLVPSNLISVALMGASGQIHFDENGDAVSKSFARYMIVNSEYVNME